METMLMIRQIQSSSLDMIDPLVIKMRERIGEISVPPSIGDAIKKSVSEGKSSLYGTFDKDDNLLGFGLWRNTSKGISFVFADDPELERNIIDEILNNHSNGCSAIMAAGPWVTESISEYLIAIGFRKLDRVFMTLSRDTIEVMKSIDLPSDMNFEIYDVKYRDEVSKVVFKGNDGHIDQIVFPNFFGSVEKCKNLLTSIENSVYGQYKKPYSWVLKKNDNIISACFVTIRSDRDSGYIPDIVVDPDFQGQRLGKAIIIHSMKKILESEPNIDKIALDVTLENNAKFLYQSLGFVSEQEYSMYTWISK